MVKLPWKWRQSFGEKWQEFEHRPWPRSTKPFYINCLYPAGPPLPDGRWLVAFINDNFSNDGSILNRSVQSATAKQSVHPWADHIFVVRKKSYQDPTFQSAVMEEDLPILVGYWKEYGKDVEL